MKNESAAGSAASSITIPGPLTKLVDRLAEHPRRFRRFLHDVRVETRQVTWPSVSDVRATTAVVIVTVFFFGVFLFLVDFGVSQVVEQVLKYFRP